MQNIFFALGSGLSHSILRFESTWRCFWSVWGACAAIKAFTGDACDI